LAPFTKYAAEAGIETLGDPDRWRVGAYTDSLFD
jgi:hypothetical protein